MDSADFSMTRTLDTMKTTTPKRAVAIGLTFGSMFLTLNDDTPAILPSLYTVDEPQQADDPPTPDRPAPYRVQAIGALGSTSSSDLNADLREDLRLSDGDDDGIAPMNLALRLSSLS